MGHFPFAVPQRPAVENHGVEALVVVIVGADVENRVLGYRDRTRPERREFRARRCIVLTGRVGRLRHACCDYRPARVRLRLVRNERARALLDQLQVAAERNPVVRRPAGGEVRVQFGNRLVVGVRDRRVGDDAQGHKVDSTARRFGVVPGRRKRERRTMPSTAMSKVIAG